MLARFWGTRGSIASPGPGTNHFGGNTSCVQLTTPSGGVLVLDCGTGARSLGNHLLASASGPIAATILLTHTHWDHIRASRFSRRCFSPTITSRSTVRKARICPLRDVLAGQMEHHYFPVELDQLAARISYEDLGEGTYEIDGVRVRAQQMNHPSPTLGYRVEAEGRSICYLCDHEPYLRGDLARRARRPEKSSRFSRRAIAVTPSTCKARTS